MFRTLSLVNMCQRRSLFFSSKPNEPSSRLVPGDGKSLQNARDYLYRYATNESRICYSFEEIYAYSLNLGKQIKEIDIKLDEINKKLDAK